MLPKGLSKKRKAAGAPSADAANLDGGHGEGSPAPAVAASGGGGATTTAAGGQLYAPLKPQDGAPLLRRDLQWDALEAIFTAVSPRFTPPTYTDEALPLFPTDRSWSFAELYLDCIANSNKANRNLKDKMSESTAFAVNFAKLCLLINVGRINTTLAFYPEMKTALRTYHPIPSMQLDDFSKKNLQDAPRMKAQLKGCRLPSDVENPPDSLAEVIRRATVLNWKPPACVVTCIFLLYNEWTRISQKYFPEGFILPDLFYPGYDKDTIPSTQRSQAFLWLVHRFLETPELVATDFANGETKLPPDELLHLTREDCTNENVDTYEEILFGAEMQKFREDFAERCKTEENANTAFVPPVTGVEATPVPEEKKGESTLLEKATIQSRRQSRASSGTPVKKARTVPQAPDHIATPTAGVTGKMLTDAASDSMPIPTVKLEPGLPAHVPTPASVTSATVTPIVTVAPPSQPTNGEDSYSHTDLWRHALKKKKGDSASVVAKLVPAVEGLAEAGIMDQWTQFYQVIPRRAHSQLQIAWEKVKRDIEQNRDPVYESEDEADWFPEELQPRISGFLFRNHTTNSKDVLRYQGKGPLFDNGRLSEYISSFNHPGRMPASSMSPEPLYSGAGPALSSSSPSGISPSLTHTTIESAQATINHDEGSEAYAMAIDNSDKA